MNTENDKAPTEQSKKKFWTDYEPIEKMTLVLTVFTVIYSLVTGGLLFIAFRELDGMKKDQRPWVKVLGQVALPEKGNTLNLSFVVVPTGKTPAKSINARFFVERVKNGESPQLLGQNQTAAMTTGILFPDQSQVVPIPYDLLSSDLEDFKEGRIFLVIYGRVDYTDIFHTQHWTDFCTFSSAKTGGYSAQKCTAYNNTDDQ